MYKTLRQDTLKFFQDDKIAKKPKDNFVSKIISEVKKFGFAYIPNKQNIIDEIQEKCPNYEINITEESVIVSE
jgi:hypothetical protein